jgi:hypothetical protein
MRGAGPLLRLASRVSKGIGGTIALELGAFYQLTVRLANAAEWTRLTAFGRYNGERPKQRIS